MRRTNKKTRKTRGKAENAWAYVAPALNYLCIFDMAFVFFLSAMLLSFNIYPEIFRAPGTDAEKQVMAMITADAIIVYLSRIWFVPFIPGLIDYVYALAVCLISPVHAMESPYRRRKRAKTDGDGTTVQYSRGVTEENMETLMRALHDATSWSTFKQIIKSNECSLNTLNDIQLAMHIRSILPYLVKNKGSAMATLPEWVRHRDNDVINRLFNGYTNSIEEHVELQTILEEQDSEFHQFRFLCHDLVSLRSRPYRRDERHVRRPCSPFLFRYGGIHL